MENNEKACFEALYFYKVAVFGERAIAVFQKHKTMSRENQDKAYFISFCVEQYKNEKGLTGAEAMQVFNRYGVLEYLQEFFDVLHSQSSQWILADIDEYINIRKKEEES